MSSTFSGLEKSGIDPIINLMIACGKDQHPKKIDLSVGVYKNEECDPNYVFPCVKAAKEALLKNDPGHYYTQLEGIPEYLACAQKTIFGKECPNATSVQAIAGSGALHMACTLLKSVGFQDFYIGAPTWSNYRGIIEHIGGSYLEYPYYNYKTRNVDMESIKQTIKNVKIKSVFVLQTACHNPTACDLSHEQWKEVFDLILSKGHFLVFDNAYQGLSSGNVDEDAWPIREAYLRKMEFIACQTYSKNLGLYSERVGCIHVCTWDLKEKENVESKLIAICRNEVSFPPAFGSRVVALVATDPELKKIWAKDVLNAAARLKDMRKKAVDWFTKLKTPGDWTHIMSLSGLFWFSGLSKLQTQKLIEEHHIYILSNGRINVAGLNNANVEYFCRCVDRVVRDYPVA
ncbi:PLP-dependent transferase [Metschnikowia bicuspidata]|uniref:PLP-dependent transferase n=1 Tax=Metschnikowia bicuspidata TaxID=27322 RepID=A0A4V1J3Q6_9ASCO|nr:PLP-dependent transferase [Metschnikowia bicuspidata]